MFYSQTFKFPIPHSCFPNCSLNSNNELILLKEIRKGEQLTIDYATLYTGSLPSFTCTCGHVGCRGRVLGFNYLPVIYQEYYLKNDAVSPGVLKIFAEKI